VSRGWPIPADYPSKKSLSEREAMDVLRNGPQIQWFEPWITRGTVFHDSDRIRHMHGYVHMRGGPGEPTRYDVKMSYDRTDLAWWLENLYKSHGDCGGCQGLFYFQPDRPVRLRMVIEEHPAVTISETRRLARRQRQQQRRSAQFHKLLLRAAELAASKAGAGS
jgi:hypothetical protein